MKKLIAFVTAILMATMVFTGCSSNELALYQNMKSMSALQNYSCSGNISIKLSKLELPSTTTTTSTASSSQDTSAVDLKTIQQMLNNASISYTGSEDTKNNKVTLDMNITLGNSTNIAVNFILNNAGDNSLLDISPIAAAFIPSEYKYTPVTINNTEYYEYDLNSIITQLGASQSSTALSTTDSTDSSAYNASIVAALKSLTTVAKSTTLQQDMQTKSLSFSDNLMNKYFNKLTLGFVKKNSANVYSCHFTASNAYATIKSLITYISKNPTGFKTSLVSFINSLTDSEIASLNVNMTKAQLVEGINSIPFSSIASYIPTMDNEIKPILSKITFNADYALAKNSASSYNTAESVSFNDTNLQGAPLLLNFSISETSKITGK
jgi:hypothetical protein